MSLLCPKCRNVMHRYERAGVVVDQCAECKGLFLDRGELEKLVEAETGWYVDDDDREGHRPEPRYEALYEARPRYDEDPRDDPPRPSDDDQHRYSKRQLRRSFLEELFG